MSSYIYMTTQNSRPSSQILQTLSRNPQLGATHILPRTRRHTPHSPSIPPAHTLKLSLELFMNLTVLRPPIRQPLHPDGRNDGENRGLESRPTLVQRNVGRDTHLRDQVKVFLVAVCVCQHIVCRVMSE